MRETDPEKSRRTSDAGRRATRLVLFVFGFLAAYFTGLFPPFFNPNELSRFQAVVAMAEWKTFAIDDAVAALGDHEDKASSGGRLYSNKAPGLAFAAYPAYGALRLFLPAPTLESSGKLFYFLRLVTVSLACLLALRRFAARLARLGGHPAAAPLVTLAVALGTPFLFYARSFFAHAWTASLLFLAWDLLRQSEELAARWPLRWAAGAGLLAAWAVISEYTVVPIAVLFAVRAAARPEWRRLAAFALAAAVPLVLLLLYNDACFGSPFTLSSAREADPGYAELARRGAFGLGAPSLQIALDFLFDPARGVLLFSPFLLWFFPGIVRWWRSGEDRADCAFVLAAVALFFVALTGYPNWHGGWSLGSRYLLPAVFFAALPIARALETPLSRGLFLAAAAFSVAGHFVLTATWAHLPPDLAWPAATSAPWFLQRGWIAQNLGTLFGATGAVTLVLPALVTAMAVVSAARAARPTRPAVLVAVLVGLAPLVALLLRPPELSYPGRLWRAALFGVFSGQDPGREELRAVALEAATPEEQRRAVGMWRAYGPPPP
ncbi:MAG: hypothetical protein WEB59_16250 [Thermoanaerobaculia bacterium]